MPNSSAAGVIGQWGNAKMYDKNVTLKVSCTTGNVALDIFLVGDSLTND